jgi:GMP synthase-like glutamine amidotransferase
MRIGILQTGAVRGELQGEFGDYPTMFRALLTNAAGDDPIEFRDYDVQRGEIPATIDECDAYLITGSRESVYDDLPWLPRLEEFVRDLDAERHPLVGICFGHQLIAQALGGETRKASQGWGVGVQRSSVLAPDRWMQPFKPEIKLLASHQDQVVELPARAKRFAGSAFCPNAGFTIGEHIVTFQGHPEFVKGYSRALLEARRATLGDDVYARGVESLDEPVDSSLVARWILNFVAAAH